MKTAAVSYFSRTGNTKEVAVAIAKEADCQANQIPVKVEKKVDLLFLGASIYWGGISSEVKNYIRKLDKNKIGKVVVFSTSGSDRAFSQVKEELKKTGIPAEDENFYCHGQFTFMHRGHPDQKDLSSARKFTKKMIEGDV